jgi:hypothetical protein
MIGDARERGIPIVDGSGTGNASVFRRGRWRGKEAELFVEEVGMTPIEAIMANISRNAALLGLGGETGVIAAGMLARHRDLEQRPDGRHHGAAAAGRDAWRSRNSLDARSPFSPPMLAEKGFYRSRLNRRFRMPQSPRQ